MKKWQSIFLVILITLGTFIQSGMSVVSAAATGTSVEEILSSKPVLSSGDTTTTKPGETKTVYENLLIKANVTLPETIYSIISLPKDKFQAPDVSDLTSSDTHITSSEILPATATAYQIKYVYKALATGSEISVPLKVRTMPNLEPGTVFPITDKTYDGNGAILSNGGELDLEYKPKMPTIMVFGTKVELGQNQIDSNHKLLVDVSTSIYVSTDTAGFVDPRSYDVSVKIPEGLEFDTAKAAANHAASPEVPDWTYDAATRVVTFLNAPDANGVHAAGGNQLPLIVKKGYVVPASYPMNGTLSLTGVANSTFSTDQDPVDITVKQDTVEMGYASKETMVQTDPSSGSYGSDGLVKGTTTQALLWSNIYLANQRTGGNLPNAHQIDSTIKSFVDTPSAQIDMSNKFSDPLNSSKETMTADNSIYTHAYFSTETAGGISKELQAEIDNNTTVVDYTDGTSETLSIKYSTMHSIGNTGTYFNTAGKTVKDIKVTFDTPIHLTSADGYNLRMELYGQITPEVLQTVKSSEYRTFTLYNDLTVNTDNVKDPTNTTDIFDIAANPFKDRAAVDLYKQYPSVSAGSLTTSASTMLSGNTIDIDAKFDVTGSNALAHKDLDNGQVVFLFNKSGVVLDEAKLAQVKNLKNLKVIVNYKNSGLTAIIGDITNGALTGDTNLDYSIPVTSTSALDTGRINVQSFLVFNNDLASYDLTKVDGGYHTQSQEFAGSDGSGKPSIGIKDSYGLYDNTDNPKAYVQSSTSFEFKPSASLRVNKWISQKDSNKWVADTNNIAKKGGEEYSYRLKISNYSLNDDFQNIEALDILPYVGDKMITNGVTDPTYHDRGTQFAVTMTGPVKNIPTGYTVLYSTDAPKEAQGMTANFASTWLTADAVTDWSKVTMIKVQANAGVTLDRTKTVTLDYDVKTPDNIDYAENLMSGNSVAVRGQNLLGTLQSDIESDTAILRTAGADPVIPDEKGSVRVEKRDAADAAILLADAQFKLTATDGTTYTGTTDSSGVYTFNDLPFGNYDLTETKAPAGYDLDSTVKKVTVDKDNARKTVSVTDQKIRTAGSIRVQKVDSNDSSHFLANAEFKLTASDGKTYTGTTNASGVYSFAGLPFGDYDLIETKAPAGYQLNTAVKKVTINKNNADIITTVKDTKNQPVVPGKTGSIRVEKVSATNHSLFLANAQFKLIASNGATYTGTTNASGVYTFTGLPVGTYELIEMKAPQGYRLNKIVNKVTITKTELNQTVRVADEKQTVKPGSNNKNKPAKKPGKLPQTGEASEQSIFFLICGWMFLLALAYPFLKRMNCNN